MQETLGQHRLQDYSSAHQLHHQSHKQQPGRTFTVENDRFMLDGVPVQLLSGSIHYFRIPPDQWRDRLVAMKAMGLNAIQVCRSRLHPHWMHGVCWGGGGQAVCQCLLHSGGGGTEWLS
jgi:hypothetical protein